MVKRPLTRIAYPVGLSARFGPPSTAVRVISPPCCGTSGCLGHNRANSQHNPSLGSGGEGPAARDCRGVLLPVPEGRGAAAYPSLVGPEPTGSREDEGGNGVGHSLPNGAGGQGRLSSDVPDGHNPRRREGPGRDFRPRHELAREVKEVIERNLGTWGGRWRFRC
jgi:hypothetical protein